MNLKTLTGKRFLTVRTFEGMIKEKANQRLFCPSVFFSISVSLKLRGVRQ